MSIALTDNSNVALYDTVTGRTIGFVFQDEDEAAAFREFASAASIDLRDLNQAEFAALYRDYNAPRPVTAEA